MVHQIHFGSYTLLDASLRASVSTMDSSINLLDQLVAAPKVRALWNYNSDTSGELTFSRGEVLAVEGDMDGNWWKGRSLKAPYRGRYMGPLESGLFPSNYVEDVTDVEVRQWIQQLQDGQPLQDDEDVGQGPRLPPRRP